ncbi:hypothetical protein DNTS_023971 [Danionella cerebrum]|uniref:Large ribosomal subunit protein bL19m n=1 Tax=Danionella cerebrum TaxID=2873325 RepID=A0A553MV73_9TELE|nr:hypothetical protein DNTS_023971 [Danionella translucida]
MAACTLLARDMMDMLRIIRILHQNERQLSTSVMKLAAGPPKFIPPTKPVFQNKRQLEASIRPILSPEFIPPRQRTVRLKFFAERIDMLQRRKVFNIPEFYPGSILAVTMIDPYANGNLHRFVGICTQRSGNGLGANFVLRNVIEGQGVEIRYELYSPRMQKIEVLKLEKRLDDDLMYLRDALPEYSTIDFNMQPVHHEPSDDVPVNKLIVKMKPKPWSKRWERSKFNIKGIDFHQCLTPQKIEHAKKWSKPWIKYDMMKVYDTNILEKEILKEVEDYQKLS